MLFRSAAYAQTAEAVTSKGIELLQAGRFSEAEKQFSEALRINPRLIETQNLKGVALDGEGRHDEARACYRSAIAANDGFAPAHANLALNAIAREKYPLAISELRRALKLAPYLENAGDLLYNLALALYRTGGYEASLQTLDRLPVKAHDASYYALAAADKRALGRVGEARADLERALKLDPSNASYLYDLAITLIQNGSPDEAIRRLTSGIEKCESCAELHAALGVAYYATGKNSDAEQHYKTAVRLQPNAPDLRAALGDLYSAAGEYEKASVEYEWASKYDGQNASYLTKQGRNLLKLQQPTKAEAAFRKAITLNPADSEAYLSLGKIANEQGRPADALGSLEKAVSLQPENSTAWYQLALTYKKSGDTQKSAAALKQFRTLSASAPTNQ